MRGEICGEDLGCFVQVLELAVVLLRRVDTSILAKSGRGSFLNRASEKCERGACIFDLSGVSVLGLVGG